VQQVPIIVSDAEGEDILAQHRCTRLFSAPLFTLLHRYMMCVICASEDNLARLFDY